MTSFRTSNVSDEVKIRIGESGIEALEPETLISAFKKTIAKYGKDKAMHQKTNNEWKHYTWEEFYNESIKFAKSLIHIGMKPFESVNILGFNSPEWFFSDIGAILAGGIAAGIYTTNNPSACKYISEHSDARVIVCDGMKQAEKYTKIWKELPKLKALVVYNDKIPSTFSCSIPIYTFEDFLQLGKDVSNDIIEERMNNQKPGNCCTLIYTSGTTGNPKAVMISHDNITWTVKNVANEFGNINNNDRMVSYLPLSHIAAQILDIHAPIVTGMNIYFAQPDALKGSLGATLKEVRPTIFFGVPRVWEKIAEKMQQIGKNTQGLKKIIVTWAKDKGMKRSELAQFGKSGGQPCGYAIANKLILSKIKNALGLDQTRSCFTGAAPIARETLDYFASIDIPIMELFGQSESTGPQTVNLVNKWKIGTCGPPLPGTQMKILAGTEELVYQGRNIMMGYMKNPIATEETIDNEGWLHSGDCAKIDEDGFMTISGRIKELIITAGGENVGPVAIEDKIKEYAKAISNCMVIGDKKKFLTAIYTLKVVFDNETGLPTEKLDSISLSISKEIGSTATNVSEAKQCSKWTTYLNDCLAKANEDATSRAQRVGKWIIVDNDFTVAGGELTPTLKLKRRIVLEKYEKEIENMYDIASGGDN